MYLFLQPDLRMQLHLQRQQLQQGLQQKHPTSLEVIWKIFGSFHDNVVDEIFLNLSPCLLIVQEGININSINSFHILIT